MIRRDTTWYNVIRSETIVTKKYQLGIIQGSTRSQQVLVALSAVSLLKILSSRPRARHKQQISIDKPAWNQVNIGERIKPLHGLRPDNVKPHMGRCVEEDIQSESAKAKQNYVYAERNIDSTQIRRSFLVLSEQRKSISSVLQCVVWEVHKVFIEGRLGFDIWVGYHLFWRENELLLQIAISINLTLDPTSGLKAGMATHNWQNSGFMACFRFKPFHDQRSRGK